MVQSIGDARRRHTQGGAGRVPPHNLAAEESLLGAMLLSRDAIGAASMACAADDFYKPAHGHIFDAVLSLNARGEPADPVTVAEELRRADLLEFIGGPTTLVSLQANTPATSNASSYAKIVEEHALLRKLIGVAGEIAEIGYGVPEDVEAAIDTAESLVFSVAERKVTDTTAVLRELLFESLERIGALYDRGEDITGVPTGYIDIDEKLSGLQRSSLVIVGARPAMGKCVAWDTPIVDPATGAMRTAAEIHRRGRAGEQVEVMSVGAHGRVAPARPSAFVDDGRRPLFRVRTRTGREVRTTLSHPFLTPIGWRPLAAIGVGMRIAVPREVPVFGSDALPGPALADLAAEVLADAEATALPPAVFRLARPHLAAFVRALFVQGGQLEWGRVGLSRVALRHGSRPLVAQIQHLLLRFGVVAVVGDHVEADETGIRRAVEVAIEVPAEIARFVAEVGLAGAHRRRDRVRCGGSVPAGSLMTAVRHARSATVAIGSCAPGAVRTAVRSVVTLPDTDVACPQLIWDEVVAVDVAGFDQVYDLTIPDDHNFVAGDVVVHNTSFALGMAAHAAVKANMPVLFFSLEMAHLEITQRLLCAEAQVDSSRLRNGRLLESDWPRITAATSRLGEAPLWIDDNPNLTILEVRARARRLKSRLGQLGVIIIDYLQLMTGRHSAESRQVEIAEMSRGLKILARELEVPVVALSQLSRNLESRADKRPMLSDLRESGCLTGGTRVLRADTGAEVTMSELLVSGEEEIPVWTVDADMKLAPGTMTRVFPSGIKPVFALVLASGRTVKASANHPFLTADGWRRLDELEIGGRVAVPRVTPRPLRTKPWAEADIILLAHLLGDGSVSLRRPLQCRTTDPAVLTAIREAAVGFGAPGVVQRQGNWSSVALSPDHPAQADPAWEWLRSLGLAGLRNRETFIPSGVFQLPDRQVALFLRHLWSSGGTIGWRSGQADVSFVAASRRLIEGVQLLLSRFGIESRIGEAAGGWHVVVHLTSQRRFLDDVGAFGMDLRRVPLLLTKLPPRGTVAVEETKRDLATSPTIGALRQLATPVLAKLADGDVSWDRIVAVEPLGEEPVYDATVEGAHNFIANGIAVHNSLEQDADVVMFIYRDEVYNPESNDKGAAEVIVAKHRNGPTGTTRLVFHDRYTRFDNASRRE